MIVFSLPSTALLQLTVFKVGYQRLSKFDQSAVKKVPDFRQYDQLWPRLQLVQPTDDLIDRDDFILIALDDQPGHSRLRIELRPEKVNCWCNRDQARGSCGSCTVSSITM